MNWSGWKPFRFWVGPNEMKMPPDILTVLLRGPEASWKGFVFRCLATQNIIITVFGVVEAIYLPSDRVTGRYVGAVWLASIGLLLAGSCLYLFIDRRRAAMGFMIAWASLLVGLLFPEL